MSEALTYSAIIPALDEGDHIEECVRAVHALEPAAELIVVDGGSQDETAARARHAGARTLVSAPGRGLQCNVGASVATGDILLFLHADTRLSPGAFELLSRAFAREKVQIGTFRLSFDCDHWLFSLYSFFSRFDSVFTSFGDQCIVVRRSFFQKIGGFPDWPLFEDVRFLQKARARTPVHSFPAPVITSARRFQRKGILRQSLRNGWYVLQYLAGVPPEELAAKYEGRRLHRLKEIENV